MPHSEKARKSRIAAGSVLSATEKARKVFELFHSADPEPSGELDFVNTFTLLVAVVLSAQSTDTGVNRATKGLFAAADSPEKMVALGEEKIRTAVSSIGLYRNKARNVAALSQLLIDRHQGFVPNDREALENLPGVGRKTASVVMNIAFGAPTIAVDTHVFRVSNRIPLAKGKSPLDVEKGLEKIVPAEFRRHAHHWLILHGRYVCKARSPNCDLCIIADLCESRQDTQRITQNTNKSSAL